MSMLTLLRRSAVQGRNIYKKVVTELPDSRIMSTKRKENRLRSATTVDTTDEVKEKNTNTVTMDSGPKPRSRRTVKIEMEQENPQASSTQSLQKQVEEITATKKRGKKIEVKDDALSSTAEEQSSNSSSPLKKKKSDQLKVEPPMNWEKLLENIRIMRSGKTAAVDTMGCERTADVNEEPKVQRFQTLVSLILSSQTKDQVTYAAMDRLKQGSCTVERMLNIDEGELAETLKPVGFYRRKATYIKKVAGILRERYSDDIPKTVEDLCALPGVGPKMAYICMNAAWKENVGIGVDTHVHRISNRLKWTGKKGTSTPEKTREALESWLPNEIWQEINILLVGFGQEVCLPIGPKCSTCLNKDICPSAEIARASKKKKLP